MTSEALKKLFKKKPSVTQHLQTSLGTKTTVFNDWDRNRETNHINSQSTKSLYEDKGAQLLDEEKLKNIFVTELINNLVGVSEESKQKLLDNLLRLAHQGGYMNMLAGACMNLLAPNNVFLDKSYVRYFNIFVEKDKIIMEERVSLSTLTKLTEEGFPEQVKIERINKKNKYLLEAVGRYELSCNANGECQCLVKVTVEHNNSLTKKIFGENGLLEWLKKKLISFGLYKDKKEKIVIPEIKKTDLNEVQADDSPKVPGMVSPGGK